MFLALDIGNSRVKYGLFDGRVLKKSGYWVGLSPNEIAERAYNLLPRRIIYSSVRSSFVPDWGHLPEGISVMALGSDTPLPIENRYHTPQTLGQDRLAAAVGAWVQFGGKNSLVIDAGSCITMDLLLNGGFEGGNIAPGLDMRLEAMHRFTDGLPRLFGRHLPKGIIGKNTEEALLLGALRGAAFEIEGFIDRCEREYGSLMLAFTGGDAVFLADTLKRKIFVLPNLVLRGLNEILIYNASLDF